MKKIKKNIGIFSTKQGHKSIAEAAKEKIERLAGDRYNVKIFYTKMPGGNSPLYMGVYHIAPKATKLPYELSVKAFNNNGELQKLIEGYFHQHSKRSTNRFIKESQIDLSVSTYFVFKSVLEKAIEEKNVPCINIINDPRTFHPCQYFPQAENNLFFEEKGLAEHQKKCPAKVAGWFVADRYEADYNQQQVRKKLNIKNHLTFLIASGSDGSAAVLKILPALINCQKPLQVFVACGNNKNLYDNILGIRHSLERFSKSQAKIIPLRFTKELHHYMQAADLVIGKAGPNTLFESVATLTPFLATVHMAQEEGNLEIIKDYNLGYVEEKAKAANKKLLEIINHPEQLEQFQATLKKMKTHNQQAGKILVTEIDAAFAKQAQKQS